MEWSQFFIRLQYFNGKKRIHSKSSAQQTRMKMETYRQQEQANKGKENNNRYNIKLGIMSHFSILQRWNNSCIQLTNVLLSSHRLKSLVGWWLCKRHHSRKKNRFLRTNHHHRTRTLRLKQTDRMYMYFS